jgi:hypothetical protein
LRPARYTIFDPSRFCMGTAERIRRSLRARTWQRCIGIVPGDPHNATI